MADDSAPQPASLLLNGVAGYLGRLQASALVGTHARVLLDEAYRSQLPGIENGPADAYRHILWSAEMTRRHGPVAGWLVTDAHELPSWTQLSRSADTGGQDNNTERGSHEMDRYNNRLGMDIGMRAQTYDDIVSSARAR